MKRFLSMVLVLTTVLGLVAFPCAPKAQGLSYSGSSSYKSGKYYTNLTKVTLTGNQRTDIVNVANSQIGYQEGGSSSELSGTVKGSGNYTEYGRWYGMQDMWCAMFVSWCANVAGVSTSVVPKHAYTPSGLSWFQERNRAYSRADVAAGKYTPQPGDIIYFRSDRNQNPTNHVGIVTKYSGGTVYTIEGNTSSATISTNGGAVCSKSYSISNTYIVYICKPNYVETDPLKTVVFDATYYSNAYSDVKSEYGTDEAALYRHFLDVGVKEGRKASPVFDVKYYVNNNSDLKSKYGTDYAAAYQHFISTGYQEVRPTAKPVSVGDEFYSKIAFTSSKNLSLSATNVIIYPNSDKPAQLWLFEKQSDGSYIIENQKNGLCLEVAGDAKTSGTNVRLGERDGSNGQKWYLYKNGSKYVMRPLCSAYCVLDVEGASTEDLTNVQIATNDNQTGQLFTLSEVVVYPDAAALGVSNAQLNVMKNIIYAVESGGQVYGKQDYAAFAEAYENSSEEHAITIGAGQWYANEAKKILNKIREAEPTTFSKLDTAGIATDLDNADWSTYKLSASSNKAKCIQKILTSAVGIWCQDQLIKEMIVGYMVEAKELGVTEMDALMMCANIRHQGGLSAVKRVLGKTKTPYTLDNIYAALQTDTGNQVGTYASRQKFVYNNLKKYITNNTDTTKKYLPACDSSYESIVLALESVGVSNVTPEYRKRLAIANGIDDYTFTAEQNVYLLNLLKAGMAVDPEGVILTGWQTMTGGKRYYYNGAGEMMYGWLTLEEGTYYLDPSTGVMVTGTQVIGGVEYVFDSNGVLAQCDHANHNQNGVCTNCGETVSHSYKAVEIAPDCSAAGYTRYTCSKCGYSYTDDVVEPLAHNYLAEIVRPTCTTEGYTEYICSGCGDSYIQDAVEPLGHEFEEKVTPPTCTTNGYTGYTCTRCGLQSSGSPVEALGHSWKGASCTEADCCSVCGETRGEPVGHSYNGFVTAPTCTEKGYTTYVCSVCGEEKIENYVDATGHSWTAASCEDAKHCAVCGETSGEALGHSYHEVVTQPTCTAKGYTTYTCTVCGASEVGDWVNPLDHTWVSTGCTESQHCSVCGAVSGTPVGHQYQAVVTAPGCTVAGYTTYICHCGDSYVGDTVSATGHSWKEADCTQPMCCVNCGVTRGEALGHIYKDGVCTECGAAESDTVTNPGLAVDYPSVSFESEILYNIYFTVENMTDVVEMGLVTFETRNANGTISDALHVYPGYSGSDGSYMAQTEGISAKNLGDAVYFKVYAKLSDGSYVYTDVAGYHAVAYAKSILKNSSNSYMKSLVVAMVNYGAEAQKYFHHNEDSLMNSFLTDAQKALVTDYRASMINGVVAVDSTKAGSLQYNGSSYAKRVPTVSFDGAFAINYYFTTAVKPDSAVKLYYWTLEDYNAATTLSPKNATGSMTMTLTEDANRYWGQISGIAAKELDETVFVVGVYSYNGTTYSTGVLNYHIGKYCAGLAAKDTSDQQDLAKATAVYGYYAKEYFANL